MPTSASSVFVPAAISRQVSGLQPLVDSARSLSSPLRRIATAMTRASPAAKVAGQHKVLVTGAAGGLMGSTGRSLAHHLLDSGVPVRALVRKDDDRAAALRAAGAEVLVGDLLVLEDVKRAVEGVQYMYFTFAVQDGLLDATTIAAMAASGAGLKGIVNNSQWCQDMSSHSPQSRHHAMSEAIFDAFPTPVVHLRGATYNMNMIVQLGPAASGGGVVKAPGMTATEVLPLVSGKDVAAVAHAVLQSFDKYANKGILLVSELRSMEDIVKDFSNALGKKVTFESISIEAWDEQLKKVAALNPTRLIHLRALWQIMKEGSHNKGLISELAAAQASVGNFLGRKPLTFGEEVASFYQAATAKAVPA